MTGLRNTREESLAIAVAEGRAVSAVATIPQAAGACLVFAPGAGGGLNQPYLVAVCAGLAARRVATLRYQFPYMEQGSRRPDPPKLCHQTVRAAVATAHDLMPNVPLFAGGKSFGGRMSSQAQAIAPLPDVRGICFFGFPLHAAKQPSTTRAEHLALITIPMLFLQGTRDDLADPALIRGVVKTLGARATLTVIEHADHSFHVLVRSGTTDEAVMNSMLDEVTAWMTRVATSSP
jgi:predicted alpha/beta-hydrolase family hydrolase